MGENGDSAESLVSLRRTVISEEEMKKCWKRTIEKRKDFIQAVIVPHDSSFISELKASLSMATAQLREPTRQMWPTIYDYRTWRLLTCLPLWKWRPILGSLRKCCKR
ncbi:hypothetical protein RRG08_057388 [Elysia crispata]|uniref:Uncharacterized protein n=1 Tax=Elysia crispata TaxID=231223 RepID=A0AAE1B2D9_9GAST|nr:hypothetical protein RRG08_057388 [Elysia crispata]